jgi:hypothetical protein
MRWLVVALAACTGGSNVVPTTVIHVDVTQTCEDPQDCTPYYGFGDCGYTLPVIEPDMVAVDATTGQKADEIYAIRQVQYTGLAGYTDDAIVPHLDDFFSYGQERGPVYDVYSGGVTLYFAGAFDGAVTDVQQNFLTAATANTLTFSMSFETNNQHAITVTEHHVIEATRPIEVHAHEPGPDEACCSVARPRDAGLVALALIFLRRRRRHPQR